ncbi:binding-protein-dependent transport systems inner membrane component [Leptothrix cholodnii SP-6]|uniref:Binding-protein-dependent transport systems inner membrane component n=1 Tax=Leptothrix cholodnii (strain ATCC 51168 / LMG 8142 / SP-6) TaxID=395495 RepID=B1XYY2_LEPCP|nr:ABC transporter permease subunit [Leptothrix cholodnii]ACB34001.1 binding-protein-dependent transport systems inner membrane component [Leptothrix cholodnii SP-6]
MSIHTTRIARLAERARALGGRNSVIGVPYVWLLIFFLLPFLILLRISLSSMDGALVTELVHWTETELTLTVRLGNYQLLFTDDLYISTYGLSLLYAGVTTLVCLAIGYPFAYFMARSAASLQPLLLMGVMLPFWTSFLLRVYAWKGLLDADTGWVGTALKALGIDQVLFALGAIPAEGQFMYSPFSLVIGMVYTYLPFMVLPLYGTLSKLDIRLLEAAQDLGATPWQTFWRVTVPLSRAGIVAGAMLVFIPCVGEYVIPELLGGPETLMIGRVLWDEFFANNDWPMASSVAVVMVMMILVPLAIFNRSQAQATHK